MLGWMVGSASEPHSVTERQWKLSIVSCHSSLPTQIILGFWIFHPSTTPVSAIKGSTQKNKTTPCSLLFQSFIPLVIALLLQVHQDFAYHTWKAASKNFHQHIGDLFSTKVDVGIASSSNFQFSLLNDVYTIYLSIYIYIYTCIEIGLKIATG